MTGTRTDVLSDVLRAVRLTGAVYFDFELSEPWVAEAPAADRIAALVMPGAQKVIEYHLLARGTAWGHALGEAPIPLGEGDVLVFPQGDPHVMSSAPGLRAPAPADVSFYARRSALPMVYEMGGGGQARARLVCGFLGFDERPFNPLLEALPKTIHLRASTAGGSSGWMDTLLHITLAEASQRTAGSENVLARLSELVFVEAIRRYIHTIPPGSRGWLAGLRDDAVGRALAILHGAPAEAWTVDGLSRRVGVSRSVLAERFTALVGRSPMQYLTLWRMQLAARWLSDGCLVAEAAAKVGYASEASFSRAFHKAVGMAPARWRRHGAAVSDGGGTVHARA